MVGFLWTFLSLFLGEFFGIRSALAGYEAFIVYKSRPGPIQNQLKSSSSKASCILCVCNEYSYTSYYIMYGHPKEEVVMIRRRGGVIRRVRNKTYS